MTSHATALLVGIGMLATTATANETAKEKLQSLYTTLFDCLGAGKGSAKCEAVENAYAAAGYGDLFADTSEGDQFLQLPGMSGWLVIDGAATTLGIWGLLFVEAGSGSSATAINVACAPYPSIQISTGTSTTYQTIVDAINTWWSNWGTGGTLASLTVASDGDVIQTAGSTFIALPGAPPKSVNASLQFGGMAGTMTFYADPAEFDVQFLIFVEDQPAGSDPTTLNTGSPPHVEVHYSSTNTYGQLVDSINDWWCTWGATGHIVALSSSADASVVNQLSGGEQLSY